MYDVEDSPTDHHHGAIECDKIHFMSNEVTIPPLEKLDCSVDTPYIDHNDADGRCSKKAFCPGGQSTLPHM